MLVRRFFYVYKPERVEWDGLSASAWSFRRGCYSATLTQNARPQPFPSLAVSFHATPSVSLGMQFLPHMATEKTTLMILKSFWEMRLWPCRNACRLAHETVCCQG